jgi:membrane-bound ClpP family serine protease
MSTFVQVAGLGLIVVGVALLSIPAAVITAGVLTVITGLALAQ